MKPTTLADLPGYREEMLSALQRQTEIRDDAFLDLPLTVAGIRVTPLTLNKRNLLRALDNPLVCGGHVGLAEAFSVLWILSPQFTPGRGILASWRRGCHKGRCQLACRKFDVVAETIRFFEDAFLDRPGGPYDPGYGDAPRAKCPGTSDLAYWVDFFFSEYHWPEEKTLNMPLTKLWQFYHEICGRKNPNYVQTQLIDVVQKKYLRQWTKAQRGEAA